MPLLTCPDCKGPVSDQAAACPKCGRPVEAAPEPPATPTPAPTPTPQPTPGYVTLKGSSAGAWIGCGLLIVLVMVFLFGVASNNNNPRSGPSSAGYKINTPQGQAEYEVCAKRAVDLIDFSGGGTTVVVPLSAVSELRRCMRDKGFTEKEIQAMVDVLLQM